MPLYSTFIPGSAMKIPSLAGPDVTVMKLSNGDIYFNDAKVISPNVLTNNGLIHVLDRVMSPNGTAPGATSTSATGTASTAAPTKTGTATGAGGTPKSSNAAQHVVAGNAVGGLLAFLGAAAVLV
jgi:hypothetical protein